MSMFLYFYIYIYVYMSIFLYFYISIFLYFYISIFLYFYNSIFLYFYISIVPEPCTIVSRTVDSHSRFLRPPDASRCLRMPPDASASFPAPPRASGMHSRYFEMMTDASQLLPVASRALLMAYGAPHALPTSAILGPHISTFFPLGQRSTAFFF